MLLKQLFTTTKKCPSAATTRKSNCAVSLTENKLKLLNQEKKENEWCCRKRKFGIKGWKEEESWTNPIGKINFGFLSADIDYFAICASNFSFVTVRWRWRTGLRYLVETKRKYHELISICFLDISFNTAGGCAEAEKSYALITNQI